MSPNHRRVAWKLFSLFLLVTITPLAVCHDRVASYMPGIGHQTQYNYGFISIQPNLTAIQIQSWTGLILVGNNYSMHWHQYANLTITVTNLAIVANILQAFYNISVHIHSNVVTVTNTTWETSLTLNGSVTSPAPTGIASDIIDYPATQGLPSFFLDSTTLASITTGSNVLIGTSRWNSVSYSTYVIRESEELCYQLVNSSTTPTEQIDTTYLIDQDVGIYYYANETRAITISSLTQTLTYYFTVQDTTVPLMPPPDPLLTIIVIAVTSITLFIVIILLLRMLWLRRRRVHLPPA